MTVETMDHSGILRTIRLPREQCCRCQDRRWPSLKSRPRSSRGNTDECHPGGQEDH